MQIDFWEGRKVLVTGASGFIGLHTVAELIRRGARVAVTTRSTNSKAEYHLIAVDEYMEEKILQFRPSIVVHLATKFLAQHSDRDIPQLIESNIAFGTRVMNVAAELGGKFLTTSSAWQHYQGRDYYPVSLYAATKQAFVTIAEFYKLSGLDFRELTLFDSFGTRDSRGKIVSILLEAAKSGHPIHMGSGNQLIDLLYVSDTVSAVLKLAQMENIGSAKYVARSHEPVTIKDLVAKIEKVTGQKINALWGQRTERPNEMNENWHFGSPVPGWHQQIDLETGLRLCWQEVQSGG